MVSKVLLRMSPSWPLSKSRQIQHPITATLTGDALADFPPCWLGLACLDLSVDPKSRISSTCKSTQIHTTSKINTNSTRTIYRAIHICTLKLNPGRQFDLASWLRITLSGTLLLYKTSFYSSPIKTSLSPPLL